MTQAFKNGATSASIGKWTREQDAPRVLIKRDTRGSSTQDKVLLSGRIVSGARGSNEVVVSVEPGSVERKLAIRMLNEALQGKTTKSNTFSRGS